MNRKIVRLQVLGVALALAAGPASAASLIVDGGFESPAPASTTPAGGPGQGYQLFGIGSTIASAWTVGYAPGTSGYSGDSVALSPTVEYAGPNIFYNAHSGDQSMDLSGDRDNGAPAGIFQTVATTAGGNYSLTFWLGSWVDQPTTSVSLFIDGLAIGTYTNGSNTGGRGSLSADPVYGNYVDGVLWQSYTYDFTAAAGTTVGFYSASASGATYVGLDDVSLTEAAAVPEPATWAMMIGGFGLVGGTLRRRKPAAITA